jgi:RND family efflux transporter MFP subunit
MEKTPMKLRLLPSGRAAQWIEIVSALGLIAGVMLWQTGAFAGGKIKPGRTPLPNAVTPRLCASAGESLNDSHAFVVQAIDLPVVYRAVGTIRSRTQVDLSPRMVARIQEIRARSGDRVARGDLLVKLDDAELVSGVRQAAERAHQAAAAMDLASTELTRSRKLLASGNVTQQSFDQADSAFRQAQAFAQAAQDAQRQAEAVLGYASITSPIDGVVAERLADPGDLASPGNIVMRLFDPSRLMLEAPIREGLVSRIRLGEPLSFRVDALSTNLTGEVREVVPAVDPGSRTFLVKLCITNAPALMPGMFGVLALPTGTRSALTVPESSVARVGQLEYVRALLGGQMRQILVRTMPAGDGWREVVSGLQPGMKIQPIGCGPFP